MAIIYNKLITDPDPLTHDQMRHNLDELQNALDNIGTIDSNISVIQGNIVDINSDITTLQADLALVTAVANVSVLGTLVDRVDSLEANAVTQEASIGLLQSETYNIGLEVDNAVNLVNTFEQRLIDIETRMTNAESNNTSIQSEVDTNQTTIQSVLDNLVTSLDASIVALEGFILDAQNIINEITAGQYTTGDPALDELLKTTHQTLINEWNSVLTQMQAQRTSLSVNVVI